MPEESQTTTRTTDAEIAELIHELRQAWFGRVEPRLSPWTRGPVAYFGSALVLLIITYFALNSGTSQSQATQVEAVFNQILLILLVLPALLAFFISQSDRPAGYLRTFLTGAAVTALIFSMSTLPVSLVYGLAG